MEISHSRSSHLMHDHCLVLNGCYLRTRVSGWSLKPLTGLNEQDRGGGNHSLDGPLLGKQWPGSDPISAFTQVRGTFIWTSNLTKKNAHTHVLIKTYVGDSNQSVHIISATGTTHEDKADANEPDAQNIGMRVCIYKIVLFLGETREALSGRTLW